MFKNFIVINWIWFLGVCFFFFLGYLSISFFLERTTSFDSAAFTFDLIQSKTFATPLNRWGSVFSQAIPLIFVKNGISLPGFLKVYSFSFIFLNLIIFLIIKVGLKNDNASIVFLISNCLSVRHTFYFPVSEFLQGLSFVVLLYALLEKSIQKNNLMHFVYLIIATIIACSLFYFNQLLIVLIVFVYAYLLIEKKVWGKISFLFSFALIIIWYSLKLILLPKDGYEKSKIPTLQTFFEQTPDFFDLPSWIYLNSFFEREYYILPFIFLFVLIILIYQKKYLLSLMILGFSLSYVLLITITYFNGSTPNMYEQYFIVFGFIISFGVISINHFTYNQMFNVFLLTLLVFGCVYVNKSHEYPTKRVEYLKLLAKYGNNYENKKFVIHSDDFPWGYGWANWAFPEETLLVSSIEDNNNSITCYVPDEGEVVNISSNNGQLLSVEWMKFMLKTAILDTNYFKIPQNTNYLITNRIDKSIPFIMEKIKHNDLWLHNVKKKSIKNNITIDKMIYLEAKYIAETSPQSKRIMFVIDKPKVGLSQIEKEIRANKNWMQNIEQKAKERNVSIEEMIKLDAQFILDGKNKK